MGAIDIVGIGQNAVDRVVLVPHFPGFGGKQRFASDLISPGGQVATAMVACARLGLRARYVGTVGDDGAAAVQRASFVAAELADVQLIERPSCPTQSAYIIIDEATGERTVLWRRDTGLELTAAEVDQSWITGARMVHLDAGDLPAAIRAAEIARSQGIPISLDADTPYDELGRLFAFTDYLIAAEGLLEKWTNEPNPAKALEKTALEYGCRAVGITLGAEGCLLLADQKLHYSPGFVVECVDTTGAGDVFHGAFCYSVLNLMSWPEALEFSNAMAALNCRALGARGAIASREDAIELIRTGRRGARKDVR